MPKRFFSYKKSYVTPKGENRLAVWWVKSLIFFKKLFTWVRANVAEGSEGKRQKNISTGNRAVGEGKVLWGHMTGPDPKVVEQAIADAKILFPDDEDAQYKYMIKKGAATMKLLEPTWEDASYVPHT